MVSKWRMICKQAAAIDQQVLERAFYMLQDECQAAFPTAW